jgi:cytochrome c oxidase cbb3-type subunit 4
MSVYGMVSVAATVLVFAAFLGIVAWAYSRRRAAAFAEAANAPFALPDEPGDGSVDGKAGGQTS